MLTACSGSSNSNAPNPGNVDLSPTDRNFITGASQASNAEIAAAKLALTKTSNAAIIAFANEMVTQHTAELTALAPIGTAVNDPIQPPGSVNPTQAAVAKTLAATPEPAFDGVYINSEISGHQMNIQNNFNPEIASGANSQVVSYATTYLPQVTMHLQMASQIKATYGF